jgi:hypothetical protein
LRREEYLLPPPSWAPDQEPAKRRTHREKANRFWRSEFVPYQKHSIAQLLDSRGPLRIVVLRNTKHLCFIAKVDEAQVVAAMNSFLKIASKTEARTD